MKTKSVLDSYALLAYLNREGGHAKVAALLASEERTVLLNTINLGEVFYILARARGNQAADHFLNVILPSLPITLVENSCEDVVAAARLKAAYPLSFADCFAAATAIREKAPLVTGDADFKKLWKTVEIDWVG